MNVFSCGVQYVPINFGLYLHFIKIQNLILIAILFLLVNIKKINGK